MTEGVDGASDAAGNARLRAARAESGKRKVRRASISNPHATIYPSMLRPVSAPNRRDCNPIIF